MLTMPTREREKETERERAENWSFSLLVAYVNIEKNVSRKGYPPFGAGDRNNNPPGTEIMRIT